LLWERKFGEKIAAYGVATAPADLGISLLVVEKVLGRMVELASKQKALAWGSLQFVKAWFGSSQVAGYGPGGEPWLCLFFSSAPGSDIDYGVGHNIDPIVVFVGINRRDEKPFLGFVVTEGRASHYLAVGESDLYL
jgi:hypothetical protein